MQRVEGPNLAHLARILHLASKAVLGWTDLDRDCDTETLTSARFRRTLALRHRTKIRTFSCCPGTPASRVACKGLADTSPAERRQPRGLWETPPPPPQQQASGPHPSPLPGALVRLFAAPWPRRAMSMSLEICQKCLGVQRVQTAALLQDHGEVGFEGKRHCWCHSTVPLLQHVAVPAVASSRYIFTSAPPNASSMLLTNCSCSA